MNSYNLIDENWIRVKYLNNEIKEIGIRQLFKDASQIKEFLSPIFREEEVYIYDVCIIKLLTTIVMSAYYKESEKYASRNLRYVKRLMENGIYSETIEKYLDEYHDRFDLYSETHPFLQNTAIRKIPDINPSDFRTWNVIAPKENNKIFGKIKRISDSDNFMDGYNMDSKEFAYFLLYIASISSSPCASPYPEKSLSASAEMFIVIKGETLKDTILLNTFALRDSSRPNAEEDIFPDKPVWELDSIADIHKYDFSKIYNNYLLCTFFPGINILCLERDEEGNPKKVYRIGKETKGTKDIPPKVSDLSLIAPDVSKTISMNYTDERSLKTFSKTEKRYCYEGYKILSSKASAICMSATENAFKNNCIVLNSLVEFNEMFDTGKREVQIYYRTYDKYKCNVISMGIVSGINEKLWVLLKDNDKHNLGIKYQGFYETAKKELKKNLCNLYKNRRPEEEAKAKEKEKNKKDKDKGKKKNPEEKEIIFSTYAKNKLSNWIEEDFFEEFIKDLEEDDIENAYDRIINKTIEIYEDYSKNSGNFIEIVRNERTLYNSLVIAKKTNNKEENNEQDRIDESERC